MAMHTAGTGAAARGHQAPRPVEGNIMQAGLVPLAV
jgi:hypothetical protein